MLNLEGIDKKKISQHMSMTISRSNNFQNYDAQDFNPFAYKANQQRFNNIVWPNNLFVEENSAKVDLSKNINHLWMKNLSN